MHGNKGTVTMIRSFSTSQIVNKLHNLFRNWHTIALELAWCILVLNLPASLDADRQLLKFSERLELWHAVTVKRYSRISLLSS